MIRFNYQLCALLLVIITLQNVNGSPFLYNSGKEIISSLFAASSSAGNNGNGNIEDLRTTHEKKQSAHHLEKEEAEFFKRTDKSETARNEASPGIVQKKLGKLLTKLQLFSTVRHALTSPKSVEIEFSNEDENEVDRDVRNASNVYKVSNSNRFQLFPPDNETSGESDNEGNKLSLANGSIGVYVMELLGGIATLIYGAALQVANAVGSTQPSNSVE